MTTSALDPVMIPTSQREQVHELQSLMEREGGAYLVGNGGEPKLQLPEAVYSLLLRILQDMREGKAVSIVPITQDMTTQDAANFLGSPPFLVKLLDRGALNHHKVGTHRRVYLTDLIAYKRQRDSARVAALDRIGQMEEEAGIYDKVLLPG